MWDKTQTRVCSDQSVSRVGPITGAAELTLSVRVGFGSPATGNPEAFFAVQEKEM